MRSRQHTISAMALVALVAAGTQASAGDGTKDGKTLYKDTCKSCHLADSPHGEYTPMSLIQDQWRDFFEHKLVPAHENVTDPSHGGKKVLDLLTPEELQILKDWTINHAADSENPMTCG